MVGNCVSEYCTACNCTQQHTIVPDSTLEMGNGKAIVRLCCVHCKKEGAAFLLADQVKAYKEYLAEETEKQWL